MAKTIDTREQIVRQTLATINAQDGLAATRTTTGEYRITFVSHGSVCARYALTPESALATAKQIVRERTEKP